MLCLIALVLSTVYICLFFNKRLERSISRASVSGHGRGEYETLLDNNRRLKEDNRILQVKLEGIIALYDITKQICRSLDIDDVFRNFRNELTKYIMVQDCKFIKGGQDISSYSGEDYTVIPLSINGEMIGRLVAEGLRKEDRERFHILSQQFLLGIKRAVLYKEVQESAIIDSLTNVFNRRHYLERFAEEIDRSRKFNHKFCCVMIDIDYFKDFNDRYGHIVGDAILRELSKVIQENIRQIDMISRYGGEEFSIILSETDKAASVFAAERIRLAVQNKHMRVYDEELKITVSIGISAYPDDGKDMNRLIDAADSALYRAKQEGRNRVCAYGIR
ncbi:MAG: GGDEF domain-containing protein [Candidatus Omnitrophota bacterium]|jgi:diguanylate cyclase (GGDEF)-like protein